MDDDTVLKIASVPNTGTAGSSLVAYLFDSSGNQLDSETVAANGSDFSAAAMGDDRVSFTYLDATGHLVQEVARFASFGAPAATIVSLAQTEFTTGERFTIKLSFPLFSPVTFSYSTHDGTAVAGTDYDSASGTVTLMPGETSATVSVNFDEGSTAHAGGNFTFRIGSELNNGQSKPVFITGSIQGTVGAYAPASAGAEAVSAGLTAGDFSSASSMIAAGSSALAVLHPETSIGAMPLDVLGSHSLLSLAAGVHGGFG
jgi:hypothetical protein